MADAARSVEECGPSALWEVFLWEHSVPMALFTPLLPENADKMFPQEHTPSPGPIHAQGLMQSVPMGTFS